MALKLQGTNSVAEPGISNDGNDGVVVGTDSVDLSIGGVSKVKLDSGGNFGIGTTSATNIVNYIGASVNGAGTGSFIDLMKADTAIFRVLTDGSKGLLETRTATPIILAPNGTEEVRVLSGGGLTFNGDTSTDNALEDYEEGTWIPQIRCSSGTGTAGGENAGYYTKIGDMVYLTGTLHWTALTGTTNTLAILINLPFTSKNATGYRSTTLIGGQNGGIEADGNSNIGMGCDPNSAFLYITKIDHSDTTAHNYSHTPTIQSTGVVYGLNISYKV